MKGPAIIPDHETGSSSDNEHSVEKPDIASAERLFALAQQRLLDVNKWHELSGTASAVFCLTDENGNEVQRTARLGDHFRIDIPGPGTASGNGKDWVQVEAIEERSTESGSVIAMRVRPVPDPTTATGDVAHFFTDEASSTFSVTRNGNVVTAAVYGRNEKPNIKPGNIIDKVRNAIVGAGAILGMNKPQWKSLVKGLLEE